MFGYIFKTGTYYLLWKKFKKEIISFIVSIVLIMMIFSIFNDIFLALKSTTFEYVIELLSLKWFLIICIVGFNLYNFKKVSTNTKTSKNENIKKSVHHHNILEKKKLKTKTDVILQKYLDKNNA